MLVKERGKDKFLVAYYVADAETDAAGLRHFLAEKLPDYMIPPYYVHLEKLPLNTNGKLDRKSLPEPELKPVDEYIVPRTKEEILLAEIWSDVLGVKRIGLRDNFFSLGGDSIKSIQISARMRSQGYALSVKDIFTSQTIEGLAGKAKETTSSSEQSSVTGEVSLTPIQHWYFARPVIDRHHFNQSVMLHFPEGIEEEAVRQIFQKLQQHHDALRMIFVSEGETVVQRVHAVLPLSLKVFDLRKERDADAAVVEKANSIQSGIDLENGPLMKLGLFQKEQGSDLLVVIHHLVIDGVSWRILLEDIESLYRQLKEKKVLSLPLKTDSFQRWARQLEAYQSSASFFKGSAYWDMMFRKRSGTIVRDYAEGENRGAYLSRESFRLSKEATSRLLTEVNKPFRTQINDILLTALLLSIREQYTADSICIDLEGHGREDIGGNVDVSRTVGWFTSLYPVLLESAEEKLSAVIKQVKETLRRIPNHGIDYLLKKHLEGKINGPGETTGSLISFNYLGDFDAAVGNRCYRTSLQGNGDTISLRNERFYDWDISGILYNGQLTINLAYSNRQYKKETIEKFLSSYERNLSQIMEYCCGYSTKEITPSDLTYNALSIAQVEELQQRYAFTDIYPLSAMQEGLLFHYLMDQQTESYFEQILVTVKGDLNIKAVEQSMNDLTKRYDILRTVFLHKQYDRPLQLILKERKIDFHYQDIQRECQSGIKEAVVESYRLKDRERKFDLSQDVLMRLAVLKTAPDEFT
ncbi:MAG TPA: condensation domain-containing protein, partial [Flavitalea sp.]|nr:condensation domain-containing protein [Flavitalea sp.]